MVSTMLLSCQLILFFRAMKYLSFLVFCIFPEVGQVLETQHSSILKGSCWAFLRLCQGGKMSVEKCANFLAVFYLLAVVNIVKYWSTEEVELSSKRCPLHCCTLLLSFKNVPVSL